MTDTVDFEVLLEQDEDGVFVADVPRLPGCHSQGRTEAEAIANVQEAIQGYLEVFGTPRSRFVGMRDVHVEG